MPKSLWGNCPDRPSFEQLVESILSSTEVKQVLSRLMSQVK